MHIVPTDIRLTENQCLLAISISLAISNPVAAYEAPDAKWKIHVVPCIVVGVFMSVI